VALLEGYSELVTEALNLQQAIFQGVVAGDVDLNKLQGLLTAVNERKDNFKAAYIEHRRSHRCATDWLLIYTPPKIRKNRQDGFSSHGK